MRLKTRLCLESVALMATAALLGCEWGGSNGNGDNWSSRYSWVNFSGVYRGPNAPLVSAYTTTSSGGSSTNGTGSSTNGIPALELIANGVANQSSYSGVLQHRPVKPGSLKITVGAGVFVLTDNGNGQLSGTGKSGSIEYGTGGWSIDLLGETVPAGTPIMASYQYAISSAAEAAATAAATKAASGSTGVTIFTFVVSQQGNLLQFTDNNGSVYNGKLSSVRTTGGIDQDTPAAQQTPVVGEQVVASYNVSGVSGAGKKVKMVGTFQGIVQGSSTRLSLADRRIFGTWIETAGKTGDINGLAAPLGLQSSVQTQVGTVTNVFLFL